MSSRALAASMRGFTLLEIMLALAIFATLAAAVLTASRYVLTQSVAVEQRLFAAWLVDNRLNELQLQTGVTLGQDQQMVRMDGRDWWLRQRVAATGDSRWLEVAIDVSLDVREQPFYRGRGWMLRP